MTVAVATIPITHNNVNNNCLGNDFLKAIVYVRVAKAFKHQLMTYIEIKPGPGSIS